MKLLLPPYKDGALPLDMLKHQDPELFGLYAEAPIGKRILLSLLNWKDRKKSIDFTIKDVISTLNADMQSSEFLIYDFWKNRLLPGIFELDETITVSNIPKHGVVYYALIPISPNKDKPIVISSDLHITQGCQEITNIEYIPDYKKLVIEFNLRYHDGAIFVFSKSKLKPQIVSGRNYETTNVKDLGFVIKVPVFFPIDKELSLYFE
jgi:hypothetical protein